MSNLTKKQLDDMLVARQKIRDYSGLTDEEINAEQFELGMEFLLLNARGNHAIATAQSKDKELKFWDFWRFHWRLHDLKTADYIIEYRRDYLSVKHTLLHEPYVIASWFDYYERHLKSLSN
jgi:hypothetical protein